ncbi:hypothetical protein [Longibaculum muris]|uniref:hypothetical protein n=1 Tax=Longibaculum muris TaxID=1796628 RepID=UPI00294309E4|nr:hypothetical protein [Longibaculum muris]
MKNVLININGNYDAVEETTNQLNELFKGTSFEAEHISTEFNTIGGEKIQLNAINIIDHSFKYYFTFGTAEYFPYQGGHVIVKARSRYEAAEKFRKEFPDYQEGFLNCSFIYSEEEWKETNMKNSVCHEIII